jgi:hypothetical protein
MLESEFMLRWVSLDVVATCALMCPPAAGDLGTRLMALILQRPSIGTTWETKAEWRKQCVALDSALDTPGFPVEEVEKLGEELKHLGQRRSTLYEPAIARRMGPTYKAYGRGFTVHPALRPDLIVDEEGSPGHGEYSVCALTAAASDKEDAIADAIRRTGHSVEFTAFMRDDLAGLEDYLRGKIESYAVMLESV